VNIFVSYRGPQSRDQIEDPGKQYSGSGYWMVTETEFENLFTEDQRFALFGRSPSILSFR